MPRSSGLSHVAMSVPIGTLTEEFRTTVKDFYGELFDWREIESLRLPDRLTFAVGGSSVRQHPRTLREHGVHRL